MRERNNPGLKSRSRKNPPNTFGKKNIQIGLTYSPNEDARDRATDGARDGAAEGTTELILDGA